MALSPFDEVTQRLFQDPGLPRIKKLLIYTCQSTWESDPHRLSQYNLQTLLTELLAIAPTLNQLEAHLRSVVSTINKAAEYALVAQSIVAHVAPLYQLQQSNEPGLDPQKVRAIANKLHASSDPLRTQKLLYATCYRTWENDPTVFMATSLEFLVSSLYQQTLAPEGLQAALHSIVKTLNRQAEYSRIAQTIVEAFQPLYDSSDEPQTQIVTAPVTPPRDDTQIIVPTEAAPPVMQAAPTDAPSSEPESAPVASSIQYSLANLFDLRLELNKFTNPLRLKMLIFSTLHSPLSEDSQIWSLLKDYELDDLLRHLFQSYRSFDLLESTLKVTAQKLPDTAQYVQAKSALLRAVKPFYAAEIEGLSLSHSGLPRMPLIQESGVPEEVRGEETCQFSSLQFQMPLAQERSPEIDDDPHTSPLSVSPPATNA